MTVGLRAIVQDYFVIEEDESEEGTGEDGNSAEHINENARQLRAALSNGMWESVAARAAPGGSQIAVGAEEIELLNKCYDDAFDKLAAESVDAFEETHEYKTFEKKKSYLELMDVSMEDAAPSVRARRADYLQTAFVAHGWGVYNVIDEYTRIGSLGSGEMLRWRVSRINKKWALCETYPELLIVPSSVSDATLEGSADFRSKRRIPALSWMHPVTKAALCRSSQPMSGMAGATSKADEALITAIRRASNDGVRLIIVDARPKLNAQANALQGKGYEKINRAKSYRHADGSKPPKTKMSLATRFLRRNRKAGSADAESKKEKRQGVGYRHVELHFMNIGNIHVMRKSELGTRSVQSTLFVVCEKMVQRSRGYRVAQPHGAHSESCSPRRAHHRGRRQRPRALQRWLGSHAPDNVDRSAAHGPFLPHHARISNIDRKGVVLVWAQVCRSTGIL